MFPHATEAIAQTAGVSPATVLKWKRQGFFQDCLPARTGDGRTTGAAYWWPEAAMLRVKHIVAARAQGFPMGEILRKLQESGVPAPRKRKKR